MIRGLYTSGLGMTAQMKSLDVISNNLANVNTTGYKKDKSIVSSFPEMLMSKMNDRDKFSAAAKPIGNVSLGVQVDEIYTNFSQGAFKKTDDQFNLAIQGDGFFTVTTPNGEERYTRDGSFIIDSSGQLKTQDGNFVMGEAGVVTLGEEFLSQAHETFIDGTGRILVDDRYIDTLNIVDFEEKSQLNKIGGNLYEGAGNAIPFNGRIMQGFLESANVNPVTAMVDLITVSRTYEANQKMIQVHDGLMGKAVNEVGRV